MIMLKNATEALLSRLEHPWGTQDQRILVQMYLEDIARWGDRYLTELKKEEARQGHQTYTFIASEVPVTFRLDSEGDVDLEGIATDTEMDVAALKADCVAYLDEINQRAAEDRAADRELERGAA